MKKNYTSNILVISILILVILPLAGGGGLFYMMSSFVKTPLNPDAEKQVFTIKTGQNLGGIARSLEKDRIISNQTFFKLFTRYKKAARKLQAGEYLLSASDSPERVLEILLKGRVKLYRITIPEGLNIKDIAKVVEDAGFCRKEEFLSLCRDSSFIIPFNIKATSLEGYLFPDTYFFPKHTTCQTIITTMIEHFNKNFILVCIVVGTSIHCSN